MLECWNVGRLECWKAERAPAEHAGAKEGLAILEKSRGETASSCNLANAARMLDGNPALMQLRVLQIG